MFLNKKSLSDEIKTDCKITITAEQIKAVTYQDLLWEALTEVKVHTESGSYSSITKDGVKVAPFVLVPKQLETK